jgi:hypothetical protein
MDETSSPEVSEPTGMATDADEERDRLIHDASAVGVDPQDALELAEGIAPGTNAADAYRFVDRRLATGYDLHDAEQIAAGETPHSHTE